MGINPIVPISATDVNEIYKITQVNSQERLRQLQESDHPLMSQKTYVKMTRAEFAQLMKNRPLIKFKPLKNSFVKKGDQAILAQGLEIEATQVDTFINELMKKDLSFFAGVYNKIESQEVTKEQVELVREYVYRHGTKEQLLKFVEHDLEDEKYALKKLYKILDDNSGELANYFVRPIHRLDNATLGKLNDIITTQLDKSQQSGYISQEENLSTAQWALNKIYLLQNNQRLIKEVNFTNYNN